MPNLVSLAPSLLPRDCNSAKKSGGARPGLLPSGLMYSVPSHLLLRVLLCAYCVAIAACARPAPSAKLGDAETQEDANNTTRGSGEEVGEGNQSLDSNGTTEETRSPSSAPDQVGGVDPASSQPSPSEQVSDSTVNPAEPNTEIQGMAWKGFLPGQAELFMATGPSLNEIIQPAVGDCTVFAALGAMATTRPTEIQAMIKRAGRTTDGTDVYSVALYNNYTGTREEVTVDAKFYTSSLSPNMFYYDRWYNDPSNGKVVIWPAIVQKAFAVLHGGYERIPPYESVEMFVLTGNDPRLIVFPSSSSLDANQPALNLNNYLAQGYLVTVDSHLLQQGKPNDSSMTTVSSSSGVNCASVGSEQFCLVKDHEYQVLSVTSNGVILRNPWGFNATLPEPMMGTMLVPFSVYSALTEITWAAEPTKSAP